VVPFQILLATVLGWLEGQQGDVIAFLREENRVLKEQLAGRRLRLTDAQRRRLAVLGHRVGRAALRDVATLVTPEQFFDGIANWSRGSGPTPGIT
jgi:putative transposase